MIPEPRIYRRGKTWWVDFGVVGGIRQRRSTEEIDEAKAAVAVEKMRQEMERHRRDLVVVSMTRTKTSEEWIADIQRGSLALDRLWRNTKSRAAQSGKVFALSRSEFDELIRASDGKCAVTGLPLLISDAPRDPFKPSIDRIDCGLGYSRGNCRVTLMAVNLAMNVWGAEVFRSIALGYASIELKALAQFPAHQFLQCGKLA